jgi:hypothetical protein
MTIKAICLDTACISGNERVDRLGNGSCRGQQEGRLATRAGKSSAGQRICEAAARGDTKRGRVGEEGTAMAALVA